MIARQRLAIWQRYHEAFEDMEVGGLVRRPVIPYYCTHNAHMYYLLLNGLDERTGFIDRLKEKRINCVFHYVSLHSAPNGIHVRRTSSDMAK